MLFSPQIGASFAEKNAESQIHLFSTCSFGSRIWIKMLSSMALPMDPKALLSYTLVGHPFMKENELIWKHVFQAFFRSTWFERNQRLVGKDCDYYRFLDND